MNFDLLQAGSSKIIQYPLFVDWPSHCSHIHTCTNTNTHAETNTHPTHMHISVCTYLYAHTNIYICSSKYTPATSQAVMHAADIQIAGSKCTGMKGSYGLVCTPYNSTSI